MLRWFWRKRGLEPESGVRRWVVQQLDVAQESTREVGAVAILWHMFEPFGPAPDDTQKWHPARAGYCGDSTLFEVGCHAIFKLDYWCSAPERVRFGDLFMPYFMQFFAMAFERHGGIVKAGDLLDVRMEQYAQLLRKGEPFDLFKEVEHLVAYTHGGRSPYQLGSDAPLMTVDCVFDRMALREYLLAYETTVSPVLRKSCEELAKAM